MILSIFRRKRPPIAERTHAAIVAAARHPVFHAVHGVPDTIEGRFEMVVLHTFLYMDRTRASADPTMKDLTQEVVDFGFFEFDRAMRDLGVSDTRVPKKMKALAAHFYGRVTSYDPVLVAGDEAGLAAAIGRVVFADEAAPGARALARHALATRAHLATVSDSILLAGDVTFPEPTA